MICIYAESHLCAFTLFFYTFICIPFLKAAQSILTIFTFLLNPHHQFQSPPPEETAPCDPDLIPVSRFQDLEIRNGNRGTAVKNEEEICAICLTEFEKEDLVNKLRRCGHVFHVECMEKWLDRFQFTCPLCRSFVLQSPSSAPCRIRPSAYCTSSPALVS